MSASGWTPGLVKLCRDLREHHMRREFEMADGPVDGDTECFDVDEQAEEMSAAQREYDDLHLARPSHDAHVIGGEVAAQVLETLDRAYADVRITRRIPVGLITHVPRTWMAPLPPDFFAAGSVIALYQSRQGEVLWSFYGRNHSATTPDDVLMFAGRNRRVHYLIGLVLSFDGIVSPAGTMRATMRRARATAGCAPLRVIGCAA